VPPVSQSPGGDVARFSVQRSGWVARCEGPCSARTEASLAMLIMLVWLKAVELLRHKIRHTSHRARNNAESSLRPRVPSSLRSPSTQRLLSLKRLDRAGNRRNRYICRYLVRFWYGRRVACKPMAGCDSVVTTILRSALSDLTKTHAKLQSLTARAW
jgi:hypothetical protein